MGAFPKLTSASSWGLGLGLVAAWFLAIPRARWFRFIPSVVRVRRRALCLAAVSSYPIVGLH